MTTQLFQLSEEVWLGRVELRIRRAGLPRDWNIHRTIITTWGEWKTQGSLLSRGAWAPPSHNKIRQVLAHHPENCLQSTQPLFSWVCWASNSKVGGRVGLTAFHWWRTYLSSLFARRESDYSRREFSLVDGSYLIIVLDYSIVTGVELDVVKAHVFRDTVLASI